MFEDFFLHGQYSVVMALGIFKKRERADKCWVISNLDSAELAHYFLPRGKSIREFLKIPGSQARSHRLRSLCAVIYVI